MMMWKSQWVIVILFHFAAISSNNVSPCFAASVDVASGHMNDDDVAVAVADDDTVDVIRLLLSPSLSSATGRKLETDAATAPFFSSSSSSSSSSFLQGNLGSLFLHASSFAATNDESNETTTPYSSLHSLVTNDPDTFKTAASTAIGNILSRHLGFTGQETFLPSTDHEIGLDPQGNLHVRCKQYVNGLELEGTSIVIHINGTDGTVFAMNGEFHNNANSDQIKQQQQEDVEGATGILACEEAMEIALKEHRLTFSTAESYSSEEWKSECQQAAVQGRDGRPYLAYKRLLGFSQNEAGVAGTSHKYNLDMLFASQTSGSLLTVQSTRYNAINLQTYNCNNSWVYPPKKCALVSSSPTKIRIKDKAIQAAHNNAIDVYNYYKTVFGRDSIDNKGRLIQSYVHYDESYDNAFWDYEYKIMVYGDGDGFDVTYLSKGLDIVAHELTHGVQQFSSRLFPLDESGAVSESFSDIMAATVDRLYGKQNETNVWRFGEQVDINPSDGMGYRDLANPPLFGDPDHYDNRLRTLSDYGAIHHNCGIMSKAFYLMVKGGTHPKSKIQVPALDGNFDKSLKTAATYFYLANENCFTEGTDFISARECTLMFAKSNESHLDTVTKAWDAVGVMPAIFVPLYNNKTLTKVSAKIKDQLFYRMNETIQVGSSVTCVIVDENGGDPDLFVNFGSRAFGDKSSSCASATNATMETCTTPPATKDTTAYVTIIAFTECKKLTINCYVNPCKQANDNCTTRKECCGGTRGKLVCDGGATKTCKLCLRSGKSCSRSSQCCNGLSCQNQKCS